MLTSVVLRALAQYGPVKQWIRRPYPTAVPRRGGDAGPCPDDGTPRVIDARAVLPGAGHPLTGTRQRAERSEGPPSSALPVIGL